MNTWLALFHSIQLISSKLHDHLQTVVSGRHYSARQFLLKKGAVANKIFFIETGLVRCFYEKSGKEISSWFMKEGDVIISVDSFYHQQPSNESIQALEDAYVYFIGYDELQFIYHSFPEFNFIGRRLTEKYYALSEQRLYTLRMQSARERYALLRDQSPELIRRVPSMYLASYLGITPETLSRIKM